MKYVALFLLLCLFGCAAPAPKDADIQVLGHQCGHGGVIALRIIVAGVAKGESAIGEVEWDNKQVCGDPT